MGATFPIPPGKGRVQPLGRGREAQSPSPLLLLGSGADPLPQHLLPRARTSHLEASQVASELPPSAPAPGRCHQRRRSLPSTESSQRRICSAPKHDSFLQPPVLVLVLLGSDLICPKGDQSPRDPPPSCWVQGPAAAADGQLWSWLTPAPGKVPNPAEGHHKHLRKWIWRQRGGWGGCDSQQSSPGKRCPLLPAARAQLPHGLPKDIALESFSAFPLAHTAGQSILAKPSVRQITSTSSLQAARLPSAHP